MSKKVTEIDFTVWNTDLIPLHLYVVKIQALLRTLLWGLPLLMLAAFFLGLYVGGRLLCSLS